MLVKGKGALVLMLLLVFERGCALLKNLVSLRLLPPTFGLAQWHCHANIHLLGITALTLKRIWSGMRTVCSVFVVPSQKFLPQFFEGILIPYIYVPTIRKVMYTYMLYVYLLFCS